jgi:hypothetical protein
MARLVRAIQFSLKQTNLADQNWMARLKRAMTVEAAAMTVEERRLSP